MPKSSWPMPAEELWYCLDIGPVHFIMLNTEAFYSDQADKMMTWLQRDLQEVNKNRDRHPWVIVFGHKPMYCSRSSPDKAENLECASKKMISIRHALEDLFYEEGVDLYISGHQHNYERTWPMYKHKAFQQGYRNPKAPIHIINGAMGYEYHINNITEKNPWSAFCLSDPRKELYGKLEVLNSSHLMWDVYAANNNEEVDSILIIQQKHGSFGQAGDEAYERMIQLEELPEAPFLWEPPAVNEGVGIFHFQALHNLPASSRRVYLYSICFSLTSILACLLGTPRFRRHICRSR